MNKQKKIRNEQTNKNIKHENVSPNYHTKSDTFSMTLKKSCRKGDLVRVGQVSNLSQILNL